MKFWNKLFSDLVNVLKKLYRFMELQILKQKKIKHSNEK